MGWSDLALQEDSTARSEAEDELDVHVVLTLALAYTVHARRNGTPSSAHALAFMACNIVPSRVGIACAVDNLRAQHDVWYSESKFLSRSNDCQPVQPTLPCRSSSEAATINIYRYV